MSNQQHVDDKHGEITIVAPSGASFSEKYHGNQKVETVLNQALKQFEKQQQIDPSKSYVLVFGATPLDAHLTLEAAGVKAGDQLKIRSKDIPGDGGSGAS
jgi:hypothetical protein